jgi:hypothetical protein
LRSTSGGGAGDDVDDEESEAEDSDGEGRDYSWKKTIMIGPSYQVSIWISGKVNGLVCLGTIDL